jgi:CheY-like chemotaxis protein
MDQSWPRYAVIVDDDRDALFLVQRALSRLCPDAKIEGFSNSLEGFEFIAQSSEAVDLILTDFRMPHLDGIKLTHAIRTFNRGVPIIIMSAYDHDADALVLGANAFVRKSSLTDDLAVALHRCGVGAVVH